MPAEKAQVLPSYPIKARGVREAYINIVTIGGIIIPIAFGTFAYFVRPWFEPPIVSTLARMAIWLVLMMAVQRFARPLKDSNGIEHQLFQCLICNPELASSEMSTEMRCLWDSWKHFSKLKERGPRLMFSLTWGLSFYIMILKGVFAAFEGSEAASWLSCSVFATFLGLPHGLPQRFALTWIAILRAGGLRGAVREAKQCWILLTCLPWDVEFVQERYTASCIRIERLQRSMIR